MIRVFQPALGDDELEAVSRVIADQWPGRGARTHAFEEAFARYVRADAEEFIALTSCTEALFQAVDALDLDETDEVIIPTISFIGAAHAVRAAGARPRLIDVEERTLNPRVDHVARGVTARTKAILLLHFGGRMPWIEEIAEFARSANIVLIEDAACSLGGTQSGRAYGTFGDIGAWSFDAMKLLVTGDGGMLRVADPCMRERIARRVNFGGTTPGGAQSAELNPRWWELNPPDWGRNAYMNDLAASIGLAQLGKVERFVQRRCAIAARYDDALREVSWLRLAPNAPLGSVPYFYWIQTAPGTRDALASHLRSEDIYTTFRYWPLHRTTLYANGTSYPGADAASATTLLLPVHQSLSDEDITRVIDAVLSFDGQ